MNEGFGSGTEDRPFDLPSSGFLAGMDLAAGDGPLRQALRGLGDAQTAYGILGDIIDYGLWVCDPGGSCTYASQSFLDLLGQPLSEIEGMGWVRFLHPDDAEETVRRWQECVRSGAEWNHEQRYRNGNGDYRHVLARGKPVRDLEGRIVMWVGLNLDISDIKATEEALREATRAKNRLLAAAGHDLKQPLQVIMLALHRITRARTDEDRATWIGQASRAVGRLGAALDSLLAASRIEMGGVKPILERVEMAKLLAAVADQFQEQARLRGLRLKLMPRAVVVETDPDMIFTILSNLLGNALKFTESGGVLLACRRRGERVSLEVVDTGCGIPPDKVESIFEEFHRINTNQSGFGLGLSIVKRTVALLGAEIKVYSEVGRGSRFVVELPAEASGAQPESVP